MPVLRQRFEDYPYYVDRLAYRHYEYNRPTARSSVCTKNGEIFLIRRLRRVEISNLEQNQAKLLDLYEHGVEQAMLNWDALERYLAG